MSREDVSINPALLQARLEGEESYNWKFITSGRTREQLRGNIYIYKGEREREKDLTLQVNQKYVSTNQYAALKAYNEMHRNDIVTNITTEYGEKKYICK